MNTDENLKQKDYTHHSNRVLNRLIKLRTKQIERAEQNHNETEKSIAQLRYELNTMTNILMERSFAKNSDFKNETEGQ